MKQATTMQQYKEPEATGAQCSVIPAHLPWYKKARLILFRFGVCPACITMSLTYSAGQFFRKLWSRK